MRHFRMGWARTAWAGAALLAGLSGFAAGARAQTQPLACAAKPGRVAQFISGEVAGDQNFRVELGRGWSFNLARAQYGWTLIVADDSGLDLSAVTPPFRGAPNPREIYGWHFRNADNTASNKGEVNAPQDMRLFLFDPGLSGTGGFKPSDGDFDADAVPGRGVLQIMDYGLADLDKGETARLVYLKFNACLNWPEAEEDLAAVSYTDETVEQFAACGLIAPYQMSAFVLPKTLGGDFDGDGALDSAAPVVNMQTGKRGIAICRAGTWLDVLGMEGDMGELQPAYFDHIDWWTLTEKGPVGIGAGGEPVPELKGDALTIGKEGASSVLIYWTGKGWASYWQGD